MSCSDDKAFFCFFCASICISASRICILFRRGISFFKDCISTLFSGVQFFNHLAHANVKTASHNRFLGRKINQVLMNCSKFNLVGPLLIRYSIWISFSGFYSIFPPRDHTTLITTAPSPLLLWQCIATPSSKCSCHKEIMHFA